MKLQAQSNIIRILFSGISLLAFLLVMAKPTNHAATSPDHPDELLRTRVYAASLKSVQQATEQIAAQLRTYGRRWKIVPAESTQSSLSHEQDNPQVTIRAVVPVLIFSDNLVVTLHGHHNHTVVNVASRSRIGRVDFGENRRHILQLLSILDQTFSGIGL